MRKHIVITGTSRGIGFELVKRFAKAGHEVLALSRNEKPIQDLGLENVTAPFFDLNTISHYKDISKWITSHWHQRVDALINNAGVLVNKPFLNTSLEDFEHVYRTNVFGVSELIRTVIPFTNKESHVVTISSVGGIQGSVKFPGLSAYSSSKAAVIALTELLAEEYKETGPHFNVLALGAVQTQMLEEAFPGYKAPLTAIEIAQYIYDFALTGHTYCNGKVLQISKSTP